MYFMYGPNINSTYQRSISTSPYELLVGTKIKQKKDIELVALLQEEGRDHFLQEREKFRTEDIVQI